MLASARNAHRGAALACARMCCCCSNWRQRRQRARDMHAADACSKPHTTNSSGAWRRARLT
ncbi:hypothetical protein ACU4GD_39175 [Cupriavidus basilensis]